MNKILSVLLATGLAIGASAVYAAGSPNGASGSAAGGAGNFGLPYLITPFDTHQARKGGAALDTSTRFNAAKQVDDMQQPKATTDIVPAQPAPQLDDMQ
ncbi:hypothetical protein [Andreprevotia chitinilytica]|uniref:hypothetical protein n=1 Tax=Andreprevotia chitinilytica TaxID=396808 RepID=UPI0012EB9E99|nr:hypothetical protein [Andreprevotia chitinilytica]